MKKDSFKNKKPLISVVMPAHNAQKYIKEAIESILSQTFKNFELIIVNDCSKDKTLEIIRNFSKSDYRIEIVSNTKRLGIANSLNKGIGCSMSNIIARMDADDVALPDRLESQYKLLGVSKNVVAVGSDIMLIDSKGEEIGERRYPNSSKELKNCLFRYSPFAHPVVVFRKKFFEEVGGYDPKYSPTEDLDLWFRLGRKYEFASVPRILLKYRLDEKSSSHKALKDVEILVFKIRLKAITKYGFQPSLYDIFYNFAQFITLWITPSKYRVRIYNLLRNNNLI